MQISSIPAIGLRSAVQAQNRVQNQMSCQPIKKAQDYEFAMPFKSVHHNEDGDSAEFSSTMEDKLDFACRLVAYYEQKYNDLRTKGSVEA